MVAFIFLSCEQETNDKLIYNLNEPDILASDDYNIYNLIANPYSPKLEKIFIDQKTGYVEIDSIELRNINGFNNLLIINYNKEKLHNKFLDEDSFLNENNVILIPVNDDDRNVFNNIYNSPHGRFLSNIGYNEDMSEAIVGVIDRIDCGMMYYTYYLKKANSIWSINWSSNYGITCD